MPDTQPQSPTERVVVLLHDDMKRAWGVIETIRETQETLGRNVQEVQQTLNGPPGSQNGLYRTVKKMEVDVADIKKNIDTLIQFKDNVAAEAKKAAIAERKELENEEKKKAALTYRKTRVIVAVIGVLSAGVGELIELIYHEIFG